MVSGEYGKPGSTYRTLRNSHQFVTAYSRNQSKDIVEFSVSTNDGVTRYYGGDGEHGARVRPRRIDARELDPAQPDGPWRELAPVTLEWALYKAIDPRGNSYQIFYESSWNGDLLDLAHGYEHRPREISYTHHEAFGKTSSEIKAERLIRFNWRTRPDAVTTYVAGAPQRSAKRLTSIEMHAPMPVLGGGRTRQQVWRYELSYGSNSASTGRSLVRKISKCSGTVCALSAAFEWSSPPEMTSRSAYNRVNTGFDLEVAGEQLPRHTIFEDFNGDNATDIWAESVDSPNLIVMGVPGCSPSSICFDNAANPRTFPEPSSDPMYPTWITTQQPYDFENDGLLEFHGRNLDGPSDTSGWRPNQDIIPINADLATDDSSWTAFADVNGDGYLDYAQVGYGNSQQYPNASYFRLLHPVTRQLTQARYAIEHQGGTDTMSIADITGDGRAELIQWQSGWYRGLDENDNVVRSDTNIHRNPGGVDNEVEPLVDLNGDGLLDVYYKADHYVRMNTGNGFGPRVNVRFIDDTSTNTDSSGFIDRGIRVSDFDGDGRQDLVTPSAGDGGPISVLHLRNGEVREDLIWHADMDVDFPAFDRGNLLTYNEFRASDVTADGLPDLTFAKDQELHVFVRLGGKPDMLVGVTDGMRRDQRIAYAPISDPAVHKPGTACSGSQRCMKQGLDVVKSHRVDNGLGASRANYNEYSYFYEDARTDMRGIGFVGFKRRIVTDRARSSGPNSAAFTVEEYNNWGQVSIPYGPGGTSNRSVYPFAGVPQRIKKYVIESSEQHVTVTEDDYGYASDGDNDGFYTVELQHRAIREYAGSGPRCPIYPGDPLSPAEPCWSQNNWPVQRSSRIDYAWSPQGQLASVQQQTLRGGTGEGFYHGQLSRTDLVFDEYGPLFLERPRLKTEYSSSPGSQYPNSSATRTTTYAHDEYGALVDEVLEPSAEEPLLTHYVRNDDQISHEPEPGQVQRVEWYAGSDIDGYYAGKGSPTRSVTYSYDAEGVFLRTSTNGLGHTTSFAVQPALGQVVSVTDENGIRRTQRYDAYGRVRAITDPTAPDIGITYHWTVTRLPSWEPGAVHSSPDRFYKITETYEDGFVTSTEYDRLGRAIVRDSSAHDLGSRRAYQSVAYDPLGRPVSEAEQHYYAASDVPLTSTTYDLRDRARVVSRPSDDNDGLEVVRIDYPSIYRRTVLDPMLGSRTEELDPDGRVVQLIESVSSTASYTTRYYYAPFGMLERVTDPAGHVTRLGYDVRGRLGQVTAPDLVPRGYEYNAFNELVAEFGGGGDTIEYRRDELGRVEARLSQSTNGNRDSVYYYWDRDGSRGRLGKLREAHHRDDDVWVRYGYDSMARPSHVEWDVRGRKMAIDTEYDSVGRVRHVKYPEVPARGRFTVTYDYTPLGFLNAVSSEAGANDRVSWTALQRDARGFLTDEWFDSGLIRTERRFYEGSGRLRSIATVANGQALPLHSFNYAYDDNGRVEQRAGFLRSESYGYDDLGRLTEWRAGTISATHENLRYQYDSLGNLHLVQSLLPTGRTPTHSYSYGDAANAGPHALTAAGIVTYQYDALRRVERITRPNGTVQLEYKPGSDLPRRMISDAATTTLSYDAFGKRVRKQTGADEVTYVPDLYERRQAEGSTSHVFYVRVGDKPIAQLTYDEATRTDTVDYLHDDHLGSISHTTTGSAAGPYSYYNPWGLRVDGTWSPGSSGYYAAAAAPSSRVSRGFTAHEHDDSLGLINMRGRIYDPHGKHFLSPDPAMLDALVAASPGADVSFDLQSPGPWPHGKSASAGKEAFSAGSSAGDYAPPSLLAAPASSSANSEQSPSALFGAAAIGNVDARTCAGSLWTNADVVPGSQELNPYSYVLNNPVRYTDPTGFVAIDTIWDAGNVLWDAGKMIVGALTGDNEMVEGAAKDLLLDGAAMLIPFVPAGITKVDDVVDAARAADKLSDGTRAADGASDVAKGAAGGERAGKSFTRGGKAEVKADNAVANNGQTTCTNCGQPTVPGQQSRAGVTPAKNETHVDHIIPKSKGGNGSPDNGQVLCRDCNLRKSDSWTP